MPYYVRIGEMPGNVSGVGARGYHLFRKQNKVITEWGGIEVTRFRQFHWCYDPGRQVLRRHSVTAAKKLMRQMDTHRTGRAGYHRLPRGARIHKPRQRS